MSDNSKIIPNPPTPLDVMMEQMNKNAPGGMSCTVKRRCNDGSLIDVSANQLSTLSTKSRVATAAQALKELPPAERTAWAIEMKDYANELYSTHHIKDAMEKYVEALAASDFGNGENMQEDKDNSNTQNNIDILIMPILCNLAACCIQLKEFSKSLQFTEQALKLRPNCGKALMRRGISSLHFGEYKKAITDFERALEITGEDSHPGAVLNVTDADRLRIPILVHKAHQGLESEIKAVAKQKKCLEKHFKPLKPKVEPGTAVNGDNVHILNNKKNSHSFAIAHVSEYILQLLNYIVLLIFGKTGMLSKDKKEA